MFGEKKKPVKKFYKKRIDLLKLVDKIKLWPSRKGMLHGIKRMLPMLLSQPIATKPFVQIIRLTAELPGG